jgi:hypothetical protein
MLSGGACPAETQWKASAQKVRTCFEYTMQQFQGFKADANTSADEKLKQYCELRGKRNKDAVTGGLDAFISGDDYSFIVDVIKQLSSKRRRRVIKSILLAFVGDSIAVMGDSEMKQELSLNLMSMSMEDAVILFYTGS